MLRAAADESTGAVCGEVTAEKSGMEVLAAGGNAVDAIVCAALTAAMASPHNTGVGGYGGHMTLAFAGTGKVTSIDTEAYSERRWTLKTTAS